MPVSKEENLKILQLLQEGKITADEASKLLAAMEKPAAPEPTPAPPPPPPPAVEKEADDDFETETLARARAKIAAAREKVAGMDQQLAAAEEQIEEAKKSPDPIGALNQALKGLPGAKNIAGAFRDFDPGRFASSAAKQAKKLGKQVTDSIGNIDINLSDIAHSFQGEPTLEQGYEVMMSLASGQTLRVKNPLGSIAVQGSSEVTEVKAAGTLRIWATTPEEAQAIAEAVQVVTETGETGGTITVTSGVKARRAELNLKVFVPAEGVKVSLISPSGDLSVRGIKAAAVTATQSGDIHLAEILGDVAAETTSGDIGIEGVVGAASAHTASGNIQAIRLDGASFKGESQSGDIQLSEAMVPSLTLSVVSGDVSLQGVTGANLNLQAVSGDVRLLDCEFPEATINAVSGNLSFTPRGSLTQGKLVISGVSGDLALTLPARTNAVLEARTRSGELRGKLRQADGSLKEIKSNGMTIVSESIGEGTGAMIVLSSVSGDLRIEQSE